ncbi:hypothetical protein [Comamonas testosteroni]|uniref:hypothetical protein n=1 Tax=Comamonas testosteroni TaxID=285 RepID=UPI002E127C97|nr:hypothetical protein U0024_16925 [Comamonas testosteroni]
MDKASSKYSHSGVKQTCRRLKRSSRANGVKTGPLICKHLQHHFQHPLQYRFAPQSCSGLACLAQSRSLQPKAGSHAGGVLTMTGQG